MEYIKKYYRHVLQVKLKPFSVELQCIGIVFCEIPSQSRIMCIVQDVSFFSTPSTLTCFQYFLQRPEALCSLQLSRFIIFDSSFINVKLTKGFFPLVFLTNSQDIDSFTFTLSVYNKVPSVYRVLPIKMFLKLMHFNFNIMNNVLEIHFFLQIYCLHFYQLLTCIDFHLLLMCVALTDLIIEMKLSDVLSFLFTKFRRSSKLQKQFFLIYFQLISMYQYINLCQLLPVVFCHFRENCVRM